MLLMLELAATLKAENAVPRHLDELAQHWPVRDQPVVRAGLGPHADFRHDGPASGGPSPPRSAVDGYTGSGRPRGGLRRTAITDGLRFLMEEAG